MSQRRFLCGYCASYLWAALIAIGCGGDASDSTSNGPLGGDPTVPEDAVIFPADNAWNTDISGAPVDPNSDDYIASIGPTIGLHADFTSDGYGIPYTVVPGNQPLVPVTFTLYADQSDMGPYPIPSNAPIEVGSDAHVLILDPENGFLYELYQGRRKNGKWYAANGAKWNLNSNAGRTPGWTSADAAGLPIFPGLVRYDEVVVKGEINHALRFTVQHTQHGYVAPASHFASSSTNPDYPPMGLRVRLKAGVDIDGYEDPVRVILTALKKYGMIVADNGSNWYITGAPDSRWDDEKMHEIGGIKGSDFEVVQHGPITTTD